MTVLEEYTEPSQATLFWCLYFNLEHMYMLMFLSDIIVLEYIFWSARLYTTQIMREYGSVKAHILAYFMQ